MHAYAEARDIALKLPIQPRSRKLNHIHAIPLKTAPT